MPGFADLQSCLGRAQGTGSGNPLQPHSVMSMRLVAVVVALIACVHAGLWALSWEQAAAPDVTGPLASVSYAPFADAEHPDRGHRPTAAQIRADLKAIAPHTRAIRTYSSTGGVELVPAIADEFDLKVTMGAWIDKHEDRNERELRSAIELAKKNQNIDGLVVGNETIYRGEQTVENLIKLIQRVKREVQVPVTTGEIWHRSPYPALLGGLLRESGGRSSNSHLRQAATDLSGQAHRDCRVRLAQRRL